MVWRSWACGDSRLACHMCPRHAANLRQGDQRRHHMRILQLALGHIQQPQLPTVRAGTG